MRTLSEWWDWIAVRILYHTSEWRHDVAMWWMWGVTGWPFERRCPQCAGEKVYLSETQARYDMDPSECDVCKGTGRVPRI